MTSPVSRLPDLARADVHAVWVRVERVRGSAPREPGASMLVPADGEPRGTIGGGRLEFDAIAHARTMLARGGRVASRRIVLGASAGQCCGGEVTLSWRRVDRRELAWIEPLATVERDGGTLWLDTDPAAPAAQAGPHTRAVAAPPADGPDPLAPRLVSRVDAAPWHVWVFGAGHVGEAVIRVLATLPVRLVWVDARASRFPADLPPDVATLESDSPAHEVRDVPPGADVLVMTHSHALDFDLCLALLGRDDLGSVGLIGSHTKAASFRARLRRRGLPPSRIDRLACPIGAQPDDAVPRRGALDRHPGAIAVSVAFELWRLRRADASPLAAGAASRAATSAAAATDAGGAGR